jgi:hypothetical protein
MELECRWEERIETRDVIGVKYTVKNCWPCYRFTKAGAKKRGITTRTLRQGGMTASFQLKSPGLRFKASAGRVESFKREHKIRQTHVTKCVSGKEKAAFEETVNAAKLFRKQSKWSQITISTV